jgi:nucleotide-binding universal stress UspA family protein
MKKHFKILLAFDGSKGSFTAADYLGKVISKQSEIVLFHVMPKLPEAFKDVSSDSLSKQDEYPLDVWRTSQVENMHELMTTACDILVAYGFAKDAISVKIRTLRSGVARDILNESHQGYGTLVLGRTGLSKINKVMMGSVAAKLVEYAGHLPVAVVGDITASPKILIAFDGSKGSMKALMCVGALFDPIVSEIILCHAIRPLNTHWSGTKQLFNPKQEADWAKANQRKIAPAISEAKRRLIDAGISPERISSEILTYQKSRAGGISKTARDNDCDTIVLGRRGFTSVGEFKLGRVSRKILHCIFHRSLWIVN